VVNVGKHIPYIECPGNGVILVGRKGHFLMNKLGPGDSKWPLHQLVGGHWMFFKRVREIHHPGKVTKNCQVLVLCFVFSGPKSHLVLTILNHPEKGHGNWQVFSTRRIAALGFDWNGKDSSPWWISLGKTDTCVSKLVDLPWTSTINKHAIHATKIMKRKGFGHLKTRLLTAKTSKNVVFGCPWWIDRYTKVSWIHHEKRVGQGVNFPMNPSSRCELRFGCDPPIRSYRNILPTLQYTNMLSWKITMFHSRCIFKRLFIQCHARFRGVWIEKLRIQWRPSEDYH